MKNIINLFLFLLVPSFNLFSMEKQKPYKKISPQELAALRAQPFAYQKLPTELQYIIRKFAGFEEPADVDCYYSQLQKAISRCDTDRVQILLALGVNPNATPYKLKTDPLTFVICPYITENRLRINIVPYLLKHGAYVNLKKGALNYNNNQPLIQAACHSENISILKILLQQSDIDLTIKDAYNRTARDIANDTANSSSNPPKKRKIFYQMAQMLKNAQAPSTIELKPLPSDQTMKIEYQNWLENPDPWN